MAVVGDGINDAPAIVQADLGIAVANASDIALEAADVILLARGVGSLGQILHLGRATYRNVKQNYALSAGFNAVGIPLAVLGQIYPLVASLFMASSSLAVVLNALRLTRVPLRESGSQ